MAEKRSNLAAVAARSGFSLMTVSRALRPGTPVAPETRAAVEAAARELGYRADPFLSSLVNYRRNLRAPRRTATFAYVMNYAPGTRWREWPVFRDYHAGFTARAAALGYGVEDFSLPEAGNARRAGEILRHRGYAGLVLAPSAGPLSRSRLDLTGFPAVTLGHSLRFPRLHYAVGDVFRCCTDTLHTLKRLGYRRPGFAAVYAHDARIEHRASSAFLGWQALFVAAEQRVPVCLAPAEKFTAAIETWFRAEKPDVVIGLGVSTGRTLERCGAGFPRDAGFASLSLDADDEPRFSGMKMDHAGMGEAAADLLHAQILRGEAGVPDHLRGVHVEARWHPGETVCRR